VAQKVPVRPKVMPTLWRRGPVAPRPCRTD
jgi:hypothetical protein